MTFQNSSFFTTSTGFTGHPFGDGSSAANGAAGSIVFALGSTYSHSAGSSPFGASGNASVVTFQTGSFARYFTATGFDASGRTYADLQIGDASTAVNASQSGAGSFQFDNLAVNSTGSANSSLTYNGSNTSAITIQGNITSVGLGDGGTLPDIILTAGSGGIVINKPGGGTLTFGNISNNGRSIDLESNTILDSGTTLNLGRIVQMGFIATRTLTANGTLVPNFLSAPGYVIGNLKKSFAVAGSKTFEVGVNGYSPVAVNATAGTFPADFTAKANTPKLPAMSGTNSLARYWALTATGITADLTFNYLAGDVTGTEANYKIVKSDGTLTAYNPSSPIDTVNHIATLNGVSSFSNWTLGQTTTVSSLNRTTSSPSNATDVTWLITFADGTDGLTAGNFELVSTGLGGSPAITGVSQTGAATWNITASTGTGDGTLGLNMVNGTGLNRTVTNLPFTGQVYAIDRTAPSTTSFTRQTPATSPTGDDTLVFRATFSEDVINVDATDFAVTGTTATITTVTPVSGSIYDLTVSGGDLAGLNGTVGLNFGGSLNITDAAGNALPNTEPGTDQTYTVENSAPDLSITKSGPATATEGNSFTYTLTVLNSNSATGAATGVSVTDVLPAGVTFVSASAGCTGTSTVTCAGADIPVGGSDTFTIVVNAGAPASVSNSADASATNDPASPHTSNSVATTINAAVCTAPPSGMVSWYPGENNANDIYGPNNGALINGTAFAPGKVGQAFSFDGNDDRVEVSPPGTLNITGNKLTMDGWINPVANTSSFYFGRSAPSDHPYLVFFSSGSNSIHIVTRTNPGSQVESDTLYAPPTNRWTHIAMVYDGATMKLYADGVEVFSAAQTGNLDSSSLPFIIGNRPAEAPGTSFNGLIDEVEVFSQALSPAQVAAIYNAGSAGKCHDSTLQFSSATYSEVENVGGGNATITVTRTGAHDTAVSVDYATIAGGSATSGGSCSGTTDYLTTSGPLSFAINETSKTFDIPICNDNFFEAAETVNLELSNAGGPGAALGSPSTAVLTINSDDPQPTISIADASQNELNTGASNFVFNVTLSNPSSTDVVIDYSTADGTINPANAGSDYTAITTGILTIPANSTSGTINVSVNGDNTVEPDETFFVNLTGVTGASMPDTQALGTIINDDTDVSVAVAPLSSAEDTGSNLVYTFTRTGVTTGPLTVNFSVGGTASFPSDYAQTGAASFSSSSGTVTIGAGNPSATVTIDPTTDISYEPSETVILTVTSGTGYNVGSPSAATGTITDDDPIPTTLVVTKTADTDDGFCSLDDCSLREAISNANVISDTNTINFAIPAATDTGCNSLTGVCTIKPSPALPTISTPVNINGYTRRLGLLPTPWLWAATRR